MRNFLPAIFLLLVTSFICNAAEKPNFVLILSDDQGYADLGCYGATDFKTPNIDQMAKEGIRFTNYYVSPFCSPTRGSLITGCYDKRIGINRPLNGPDIGLHPDEITIAEFLKEAGYATAIVGKWHLGLHDSMSPIAQGFDYFAGIPLSHIRLGPTEHTDGPNKYYRRQWKTMGKEIKTKIEYDLNEPLFTKRIHNEAVALLKKYKDEPFFLFISHAQVHREVMASKEFQGRTKFGVYGDAVEELDWSVGEVLKTLKELGLDEKTLVIYQSDNGPSPHEVGSARPLRGKKGSTWEGGTRVPCIMRWPGKIPPGQTCDQVAGAIDLFPTIAAIIGKKVPQDRVIDGRNIWPLMIGAEGAKSPRDSHFYFSPRSGAVAAVRKDNWKLHRFRDRGKWQLFDLKKDVGETTDVSKDNPEVVAELQKSLMGMRNDLSKNARPLGRVEVK